MVPGYALPRCSETELGNELSTPSVTTNAMLTSQQLRDIPINAEALELVPESVARENIVLAIAVHDGVLHLILPASVVDSQRKDLEDKLRFILVRSLTFDTADDDELKQLVDLHYTAVNTTVQNCDIAFQNRCPLRWANLEPTDTPRQRWCSECGRTVTFCLSNEELKRLSSAGQCVAFWDPTESVDLMGLIDFEVSVEYECVEAFRRGLQTTEDPIVIRVGELGHIEFLNTQTFDASYLDFCNDFIRRTHEYPQAAREGMRIRRDSIFPYLGMQILHGGMSYDGISVNAFILKSTGQLLCCEIETRASDEI